jgi:hypothetical protein
LDAIVALPPLWLAAVLLLARTIAARYELAFPSVDAILTATGASRSRAYELVARLCALLPTLVRAPGRPPRPAPPSPSEEPALTRAVLAYVMAHPGCVDRGAERQRYADAFRRFVLDLQTTHASVELDSFARAVAIPLGTLKDWLRHPQSEPIAQTKEAPVPTASPDIQITHVQTVLHAWSRWRGSFLDFCEHVRRDLHVSFGRDLVRHVLEVEGQRKPARRDGRSPDERAMRGAFRTYFPGAQWVGDGMQVPIVVDGQRFVFNVELDVDAYSGAFVGTSVSDTEDSVAVTDTFASGVATTGAPPLALLLDNKPTNHTPEVDVALGSTLRLRATPERPQNKAHVEGAFGLFSQVLPQLVFGTRAGAHALARGFLTVLVGVWARTTNHRPRHDRSGRSRFELYSDAPTDEQIERARRELRDLADRQERARRTLEARRRPCVLAFLDDQFARLRLLDPQRHIRIAIAGYPTDPIVDGLFIFESKRRANTLPDGADARYLLGIVKNVAAKTELEILAETLYRGRMEMRDRLLAPLRAQRDALRQEPDVGNLLMECVAQATATDSNLERTFWLDTIVETLRELPDADRQQRFLHTARLIAASFAVPPRVREDAVRFIADRLAPLR